ncbi:hypothetical protein EVJ58_g10875, partial [Rhodofomes roseus]
MSSPASPVFAISQSITDTLSTATPPDASPASASETSTLPGQKSPMTTVSLVSSIARSVSPATSAILASSPWLTSNGGSASTGGAPPGERRHEPAIRDQRRQPLPLLVPPKEHGGPAVLLAARVEAREEPAEG